jgi:hypothetical protein
VRKGIVSTALAALLGLAGEGAGAWASPLAPSPAGDAASEPDPMPPRLVYTHGQVSFWRPGAEDWGPAQVNTPLAPGDLLYAAPGGTVELLVGARAFARAGGGQTGAEIGLDRLEPDYLQLKVASGIASLDVRELPPGDTMDVNTPDGVLTIERAGYYRIESGAERTAFVVHRGGPAALTVEDGARVAVRQAEQVVVAGPENRVELSAAPEPSDWDRWNFARTDALLPGASAQHVPAGVYGVGELDRHGSWRVVPEYGSVWVPAGVPPGWAPYSTGRWIWDPYFEWTWVDDAPWGWAPYHHGRWVHVGGYWAWAPGPVVAAPRYAPALVTFLDPVVVTVGRPVSWVALGWGEPCVPWWGASRFAGRPWWGGWGGPRVHHGHRNLHVHRAVVTVPADRFGRGAVEASRLRTVEVAGLRPVSGALGIRPTSRSVAPAIGHAVEPKASGRRDVVAIRPPHDAVSRLSAEGLATPAAATGAAPRTRLVTLPDRERRLPPAERREPAGVRKPSDAGPETRHPAARPEAAAPRPQGAPTPPARGIEPRAAEGRRDRPVERQRRVSPPPARETPRASRPTAPAAPSAGADPAPRVERGSEARRPARGQDAPARTRVPARVQEAPSALESRGVPRAVRHQPSGLPVPARPSIQEPPEKRRPSASPAVQPAHRPGGDRVDARRGRVERIAPEASSRSGEASSTPRGESGRKRGREAAEGGAARKAR